MASKKYKALFVKEESHYLFKELAAKKNKKMNDLFDEVFIPKQKIPSFNLNMSFINIKPPKRLKKKGNVFLEISFIIVFLISLIMGYMYLTPVNDVVKEVISTDDTISNVSKNLALPQLDRYETRNDTFIIFLFGFIWITTIATSFLVDVEPIFFIVSLVIFISLLSAIMFLGNVTEEILIQDHGTILHLYPNSFFIASHLLEIIIGTALFIFIALFAKRQVGG